MMLHHGINDNILIYDPSYLVIYQHEAKIELYKEINLFWGWNQIEKLTKMQCTLVMQ